MTRGKPLTKHRAPEAERLFIESAKAHFNDAQMVELAATTAMENYRAWLNPAFLVETQGV